MAEHLGGLCDCVMMSFCLWADRVPGERLHLARLQYVFPYGHMVLLFREYSGELHMV